MVTALAQAEEQIIQERTAEMIGRTSSKVLVSMPVVKHTVDWTKVDYTFWAKFRRGKAKGYEIGGLFGQPIGQITRDWTLGKGFSFRAGDHENTEEALSEFVRTNRQHLLEFLYDAITLGDGYLVVNPDGSLTLVPPNQVEVLTDPLDYRTVIGYKITSILEKAKVIDEYRLDKRIVTFEWLDSKMGPKPEPIEYPNIIGRLPVVHLAFGRESNEIYGHPIYESLLTLFGEYDDVIRKALDGVKIMGNPIPVIEGAEDPEGEIERLQSPDDAEYRSPTSAIRQEQPAIDFTSNEMFVLGMGAKFKFAAPGSFTQDAGNMLEYLFLLMLQHSRIPEWAWGGAIASSKASVDSQLPAFAMFIEGMQSVLGVTLIEMAQVWLAYRSMVVPGLDADAEISVQWNPLVNKDEQIVQSWVKMLHSSGLLTDKTAVEASGLVEDPQAEVDAAKAETEAARDAFESRVEQEMGDLNSQTDGKAMVA